jgi:hypothetical protein
MATFTTYPGSGTFPGPNTFPGQSTLVAGAYETDNTGTGTGTYSLGLPKAYETDNTGTGIGSYLLAYAGAFSYVTSTIGVGTGTYLLTLAVYTGPTLTASVDPLALPPRVLVQAFNIGGPSGNITRLDPDGASRPVREGDPVSLSGGGAAVFDYEMPYNQPITYTITPTSSPTTPTSSMTVTLLVSRPWLVHPGVPFLSQPLTIQLFADETIPANVGIHDVLQRETPITISDGRRKSPRSMLQVKTMTRSQADGLDQLLLDESPLLLQATYPFTTEQMYAWISILDVNRARRTAMFGDPSRVWQLPYVVVDRPTGAIQSVRTWQDVVNQYDTWQDVMNDFQTWRGVLTGLRGT